MSRDRAAYMREYRALQRAKIKRSEEPVTVVPFEHLNAANRIHELEEEVRHLKAELAKRPTFTAEAMRSQGGYNTRPFTPVPKTKGR